MIQNKLQSAGKTQSTRVSRRTSFGIPFARAAPKVGAFGDTGLDRLGNALRANREAVTHCIALPGEDRAVAGEVRLAINRFLFR